ncbi:hypothetical protein ACWENQ_45630 [Nonomuraea sp. NPDC004354]
MDEAEWDQRFAKVTAAVAELLVAARRERDRCARAGEDIAWLDEVVQALEPLGDLVTLRAIHAVVDRHGAGPYPVEELAAIAGADVASVKRVLAQMTADGFAMRGESDGNTPK